MPPPVSKLPLFVFEALGSLAGGFYGNYIFFLFRDRNGFGDLGNLGVAALMGFVIAVAAWQGGKFAQRQGCFRAMFLGQGGMMAALSLGALFPQLPVQLAVLVLWTASQFVVWPALESLVTEGEDRTKRAMLAASIGFTAGLLCLHIAKYGQLNGYLAEYLSGLHRVETGATVLPLDVSTIRHDGSSRVLLTRLGNVKVDPLAHASQYMAIERHAVPFDNYEANIGYFPVLFRPERDPYVHIGPIERRPPAVDFLRYYSRTGGRVDYLLLLLGHRTDPGDGVRKSVYRQLANGYELIYTSPQGLVNLYRRKDWTPTVFE